MANLFHYASNFEQLLTCANSDAYAYIDYAKIVDSFTMSPYVVELYFQLERAPGSDYTHWQLHFILNCDLKLLLRRKQTQYDWIYTSFLHLDFPVANDNGEIKLARTVRGSINYATKRDTRVEGPYHLRK